MCPACIVVWPLSYVLAAFLGVGVTSVSRNADDQQLQELRADYQENYGDNVWLQLDQESFNQEMLNRIALNLDLEDSHQEIIDRLNTGLASEESENIIGPFTKAFHQAAKETPLFIEACIKDDAERTVCKRDSVIERDILTFLGSREHALLMLVPVMVFTAVTLPPLHALLLAKRARLATRLFAFLGASSVYVGGSAGLIQLLDNANFAVDEALTGYSTVSPSDLDAGLSAPGNYSLLTKVRHFVFSPKPIPFEMRSDEEFQNMLLGMVANISVPYADWSGETTGLN